MDFEHDGKTKKLGEKIGFLFGYFMFMTFLFLLFALTKKLSSGWTYLHIISITLGIILMGILIEKALK